MRYYSLFILILLQLGLFAQDIKLKVEVSTDSILLGNYLEVRFTIKNAGGDFNAPEFESFEVLSGPNTSSSFSMVNGNVSQQASYTYVIRPVKEGVIYIEPASFETGDKVLETDPVMIIVHPNPAGIEENKPFKQGLEEMEWFFSEPSKKQKKKEKKNPLEKEKRRI